MLLYFNLKGAASFRVIIWDSRGLIVFLSRQLNKSMNLWSGDDSSLVQDLKISQPLLTTPPNRPPILNSNFHNQIRHVPNQPTIKSGPFGTSLRRRTVKHPWCTVVGLWKLTPRVNDLVFESGPNYDRLPTQICNRRVETLIRRTNFCFYSNVTVIFNQSIGYNHGGYYYLIRSVRSS